MGKSRLEAFSDGVFSIAITLLIFTVVAPSSTSDLGERLLRLWPSYLAYGGSFLVIGQVWLNHHAMFSHIRRTDSTLIVLNLLLLMDVSVLPFPTSVIGAALHDRQGERLAVVLYGATLFLGGIFFNAVWQYAVRHELTEPGLSPQQLRSTGRRFLIGPASYLAATLIGLLAPLAALFLFIAIIVFYLAPGPQHRLLDRDDGPAPSRIAETQYPAAGGSESGQGRREAS
jgi:uncharacterized membrane protein